MLMLFHSKITLLDNIHFYHIHFTDGRSAFDVFVSEEGEIYYYRAQYILSCHLLRMCLNVCRNQSLVTLAKTKPGLVTKRQTT